MGKFKLFNLKNKFLLFLFIISLPKLCLGQKISTDSIINKWTHAVINVECIPENEFNDDFYRKAFNENKITWERYNKITDSLRLISSRYSGTVIYLEHNNKYYLLTARHVINDLTRTTDSLAVFEKIILLERPTTLNNFQGMTVDNYGNMTLGSKAELIFLMNYSVGPYENRPYIFSSMQDDLGIISLDTYTGKLFNNTLKKRGYVPIKISDIDTLCKIKKDNKIMAFGFTENMSVVQSKRLPIQMFNWESLYISRPIVSTGTIADPMMGLNYFYSDIFIYHGNSGGAVVLNNKLVGLVHGYKLDNIKIGDMDYGLYHNILIKSSLILPLLRKLESKNFYK